MTSYHNLRLSCKQFVFVCKFMSVRFFDEGVNDEDIPLVKDYLRLNPNLDEIFIVRKFVMGSKGILVICDSFKGSIWRNSKVYGELVEAIQELPAILDYAPTFVTAALLNGQLRIGVDEEEMGQGVWVKDSDNTYAFKEKKEEVASTTRTNRFLAASQKSLLLARSREPEESTSEVITEKRKKSS